MKNSTRRLAAVIATGALIAAGLTLGATAANATQLPGAITLYAAGSNEGADQSKVITSGSATTNPMFYGITINGTCPVGARDAAIIYVIQNGVKMGSLAQKNDSTLDGVYGTNGLGASDTSIHMDESTTVPGTNPYVDNKSLDSITTPLAAGAFEVRYYCFADFQNQDLVNDKYFSVTLNYDATAHTWSTPIAKINTSTSITAAADQTAKTVAIDATIKNAAGTSALASATGTATVNQTAPTAAVLGTATVAAGVATFTTGVLTPGTYVFTVTYSGDAAYNGSTSGSATGTINGANSGATNITFTVDAGSGGGSLTLSNVPAAVDLGHATLNGGLLTASNLTAFAGVTVTDTRSIDSLPWNLTGQMGSFVSGNHNLSGNVLGWAPFVQSGPATAGATVAANSPGLGNAAQLATAPVTNGQSVSTVGAALNVAIPSNSATGTYSGVITLTLV
jgi:hypothetical protein